MRKIATQLFIFLILLLAVNGCSWWYEWDAYENYHGFQSPGLKVEKYQLESFPPNQTPVSSPVILPTTGSTAFWLDNGDSPGQITPEEELELVISEFVNRGKPVPEYLRCKVTETLNQSTQQIGQDRNSLHGIMVETTNQNPRFLLQFNRLPQYRENTISEADHFRLYFDFLDTQLAVSNQKLVIQGSPVYQIRSGQFDPSTTRIVLDARMAFSYQVYPNENQTGIIVELAPGQKTTPVPLSTNQCRLTIPNRPPMKESNNLGLAQELGLRIRRVIIDAGHGGAAPGAVGLSGLKEKDVALDIALRLHTIIQQSGEFEAFLTRDADYNVSLTERTQIANQLQGDLFISIHINAHKQREKHGVETYYLSLAKDPESRLVAAKENMTAQHEYSNLERMLKDILKNSKIKESAMLAEVVQNRLASQTNLYNRGVRHAGFVVLIGARMPSVLVEAGFISNPNEEQQLYNPQFREKIAQSLFEAIRDYSRQPAMLVNLKNY